MNERVVFVCACIAGLGFFLEAIVLFCRFLKKPSKHRLIECYVDPATYDRLQSMASDLVVPLATFCACCLESIDPVEFMDAYDEAMNEVLSGSFTVECPAEPVK